MSLFLEELKKLLNLNERWFIYQKCLEMLEDTARFDEQVVSSIPALYMLEDFDITMYRGNFHVHHKKSCKEFTISYEDLYKIVN